MDHGNWHNYRVQRDDSGVMTITLDVPGRRFNVFDENVFRELQAIVESLENDADVRLAVFRSGKDSGFLIHKVAVCGAGVMGAAIAQLAAYHGLEVVLNDVDQRLLAAAMRRISDLMDQAVSRGRLSRSDAAARMENIKTRVEGTGVADLDLETVDLVIEAVPERSHVKRDVFRQWDQQTNPLALLASNTSALSIKGLAEATSRSGQVAGLHFFNPAHRMPLVEVVRAESTSDETIATLVEFVRRLEKTPVVVADAPGFLVNRILWPYLDEAVRMVWEGIRADEVDERARRFGMPMGPLELLDQVGIDVAADVADSLAALASEASPTPALMREMIDRGWLGKKTGVGFYRYRNGRRREAASAGQRAESGKLAEIVPRLGHVLINEAARCVQERIVPEVWMVDLAMVLGAGFAPFRGGPLHLADDCGILHIVRQLEMLQRSHGDRFAPCALLQQMNEQGREFFPSPEQSDETAAAHAANRFGAA